MCDFSGAKRARPRGSSWPAARRASIVVRIKRRADAIVGKVARAEAATNGAYGRDRIALG